MEDLNLNEMDQRIKVIKKAAEDLLELSPRFPAMEKNTARILASIRMLEMNISDVLELEVEGWE